MPAYLFQIELPPFTQEIVSLIPNHRGHITRLFSEGRILSYSVSLNRDKVWCVINAEDEEESMEILVAFPLYTYFIDVICTPLLFHNTLPATQQTIILN